MNAHLASSGEDVIFSPGKYYVLSGGCCICIYGFGLKKKVTGGQTFLNPYAASRPPLCAHLECCESIQYSDLQEIQKTESTSLFVFKSQSRAFMRTNNINIIFQ